MKTRPVLLTILLLQTTSLVIGQLPRTSISSLFPPGGQHGNSVEITLQGKEINDAKWLKFTHDGIHAEPIKDDTDEIIPGKFNVKIAKEVPPGLYEAQLGGGRFGASNVASFVVGTLPVVLAPSDNTSMDKAFAIELDTTITGKTVARNYSYFKFDGKKGQKLLIHCASEEIDSQLVPVLNVRDKDGNEIASVSNIGILDFSPPADGEYFIQLFDFLYNGSDLHYYQLSISGRPYIDYVEPPIGKPGTKARFTVFGRNLPGGQTSGVKLPSGKELQKKEVEIQLPANADEKDPDKMPGKVGPQEMLLPAFQYRMESPKGPSNPVLISLSHEKIVHETNEPNEKPGQAQKIEVPCEFAGRFFPFADKDYMQFDAKKGDSYWIEGFSERLGRPSNLFFLIQQVTKNDKGEEQVKDMKEVVDNPRKLGGHAFKTGTNDPLYRFEAPVDATYRILTYDLFDSGVSDIRNQYRLSIRRESPGFTLIAYVQSPPPADNNSSPVSSWPASIRQGEILPLRLIAHRRDNFKESIALDIQGLPSTISWGPKTIAAGMNEVTILLEAKADAQPWSGRISISGKTRVNGKDVTRKCLTAGVVRASYDKQTKIPKVQTRLMKALALDVNANEKCPVTLRPKEDKVWETSIHGKIKIPFLISQTDDGFKQNRKVKVRGHELLAKVKEINLDTKKDDGVFELNLTQTKFPVGEYPLYLTTLIKGKYKRETEERKKAADEAAKKADQEAKAAVAAAKKAEAEYNAVKNKKDAPDAEKKEKQMALEAAKKKSSQAEAHKKRAQDRAKQMANGVKPVDVNETFYSPSFILRVTDAPIKLKPLQAIKIKAGEKVDWNIGIERLYEFKDVVNLNLVLPKGAKGVTIKKGSIAKEKNDGTVNLTAGKTVTAGDFVAKLEATLRLNNQNIKLSGDVKLKVEAAPKEKAGG